ncbi:Pentatricopeptide repeat-containing protein [Acorus calamus]|uniref:Pentatricopeptide repeat-containing protein n=1 Tax=Acorus calamus TaxID=4465 RepID=A0AAV9D3I0_ACOCL|nr:Pentatricopeptide repeat-containing protein [Acorus calamus]
MVGCFACAADTLSTHPTHSVHNNNNNNNNSSRRRTFDLREALHLLRASRGPMQLKQVHANIIRTHPHQPDAVLLTNLIRLYSSHHAIDYAHRVFLHIPNPPTFAWNLIIRAHSLNASPRQAILLYNLMTLRAVPPDKFTFPFVLKACSLCSAIDKGQEVHARALKSGRSKDIFVQNTLMHLYFTCGDPLSGRKVFDEMNFRSVISWTALIAGYAACGELEAARDVFERTRVRNVVTWTAMINACASNGRPDEAFELFWQMRAEGVEPNEYTIVGLLGACAELGSLNLGEWVHNLVRKNGLELSVFVGTALIDMYSKCGSLEDALCVFEGMRVKGLATWNSMITGLGVHGRGREVIALFREMERGDVRPDKLTFIGVLSACVRAGLLEEGLWYFHYMRKRYGIEPGVEHFGCVIELLGRAGMLDDAHEILKSLEDGSLDDVDELLHESLNRWELVPLMMRGGKVNHSMQMRGQSYEWEVG